jgi:hypothetical protein
MGRYVGTQLAHTVKEGQRIACGIFLGVIASQCYSVVTNTDKSYAKQWVMGLS